jgi:Cu(I)/Ag(I) efflux system periplasmic protein CusF
VKLRATTKDLKMKRNMLGLALLAALALPALAQTGAEMTDGEVRKVDKGAGKITLKHGEIKSLDMPSMTMVFRVGDTAMLDQVKPGDKVRFKAAKSGGAIVITEMRPAP